METSSNLKEIIIYIITINSIVLIISLFTVARLRISLRKHMLEEEKLRFIFADISPTPIIRTDASGIINYNNNKAKKKFGKEELLNLNIKDIFIELKGMEFTNATHKLVRLGNKYYSMEARYIENLKNWQFYFYNIKEQLEKIKKTDIAKLTHREKQIFDLVSLGFTTKEIANKLSCSERTISTHRHNIYKKLNLHTNTNIFENVTVEKRLA